MSTPTLPAPGALERMSRRLTAPFAAGGDVLPLVLTAGATGSQALVAPYDFSDHQARYGATPQPSYVLRARADVAGDTVVTVRVEGPGITGGGADVPVPVPVGTLTGESAVIPLPPGADASARLRRLTVGGPAAASPAELAWEITALLGTTARVLWVLGGERDTLRRQVERTAAQRRLSDATGASLDFIGSDLAVPRFPPLPYPFDEDTVALYHLDEPAGASSLEDFTGRFPGRTGHNAVPAPGVLCGSTGRFGPGVRFPAAGTVRAASSPDFDIAATASATMECFVRPDPATGDGLLLGRRDGADSGAAAGPGWTLEVGEFGRGLPRSVHVAAADGAVAIDFFADLSLPTDQFTHLALTLDRDAATLTLRVNGAVVHTADASSLRAIDPAADLVIGPGTTAFRGWVDEVRLSSVARTEFHPVLGEADDTYRRRLTLFRQWVLPTPGTLATVLNALVGEIGGLSDPLVVDDTDAAMVRGTAQVRVVPAQLQGGESIDLAGRRGATEADLAPDGADPGFDPAFLVQHTDPVLDYGPAVGSATATAAGDPHAMQLGLSNDLDRFAATLGQLNPPPPGRLRVVSAYTPGTGDAAAEGRSLTLRHSGITLARLGALAHASGFDLVTMLPRGAGVQVVTAPGRMVILSAAASVTVGGAVALSIQPPLPAAATATWDVITGGPGRADLSAAAGGTVTLTGRQPGDVVVGVDVALGVHATTVTAPVTVQPVTVADGTSIAADGTLGAPGDPAAVTGAPEAAIDVRYLVTSSDPRASYASADSHLMQLGVASHLTALLDLTGATAAAPLQVLSAFQASAGSPDLASSGRTLTIQHPTLAAGDLAAAAHVAGFGYAEVSGADVIVADADANLLAVAAPDQVEEGASVTVTVSPDPATISATTRLAWSSGGLDGGQAGLTSTTAPSAQLVGIQAGLVWVQAVQREAGAAGPYCVQVRLRPELAAASATISREQYDLIMNALNALHPLGVEVLTRDVRAAVVELAGVAELDPSYTYPRFRLHRPTALLRKDPTNG